MWTGGEAPATFENRTGGAPPLTWLGIPRVRAAAPHVLVECFTCAIAIFIEVKEQKVKCQSLLKISYLPVSSSNHGIMNNHFAKTRTAFCD